MNLAELRAAFRNFAGQEQYSKFVRVLNIDSRSKGRLFFWQEQLWNKFASNIPGTPASLEDILHILSFCDVHNSKLDDWPLHLPTPPVRDTAEFDHATRTLFPFADVAHFSCNQCRLERHRWVTENFELCKILRRETTYEEYCDRILEGLEPAVSENMKKQADVRIKQKAAEIAAEMKPGDQLWEWDGGGWHKLAGRGGVAIVRNGEIVKKWCEIKS